MTLLVGKNAHMHFNEHLKMVMQSFMYFLDCNMAAKLVTLLQVILHLIVHAGTAYTAYFIHIHVIYVMCMYIQKCKICSATEIHMQVFLGCQN